MDLEEHDADDYNQEISQLKQEVRTLTDDNASLLHDKEMLLKQLQTLNSKSDVYQNDDVGRTQQLELLQRENVTLREMLSELESRAKHLTDELQAERMSNPQAAQLKKEAELLKAHYDATIGKIESQLHLSQEELRDISVQRNAVQLQNKDLLRRVDELEQEARRLELENVNLKSKVGELERGCEEARMGVREAQQHMLLNAKEQENWKRERSEMRELIGDLQKQVRDEEQRALEAAMQVKQAVEMAEHAMMERDESVLREKQKSEECEKLQVAINKLINEAGEQTAKQVDEIKNQANSNMQRLLSDITTLEEEKATLKLDFEKALSRARNVEKELEAVQRQLSDHQRNANENSTVLMRRIAELERESGERQIRTDSLQSNLKQLEKNSNDERSLLREQVQSLNTHIEKLQNKHSELTHSYLELQRANEEAKRREHEAVEQRDETSRKYAEQTIILTEQFKIREKQLKTQQSAIEDSQSNSLLELRNLLASQQRVNSRWKQEVQTLTNEYEAKIRSLTEELVRTRSRNEELTRIMQDMRLKIDDSEQTTAQYTRHIRDLEERLRDFEQRRQISDQQIARMTAKQRLLSLTLNRGGSSAPLASNANATTRQDIRERIAALARQRDSASRQYDDEDEYGAPAD